MLSVIIPTYNESENIRLLVPLIVSSVSKKFTDYEIIIVDDSSPDGTGSIVNSLSKKFPQVRLIVRKQKSGLTGAIVAGVNAAKGNWIIIMDADLSHPPDVVPLLASQLDAFDVVIGSRLMKGGKVENWPLHRKLMSDGANFLASLLLGVHISDPLSGFFAIRKDIFTKIRFRTKGYKLLLNILHDTPNFLLAFLLVSLLSVAIFYPALVSFGKVLYGTEDIRFFLWLFWHFENKLTAGQNPFFADEVFYPYGISLFATGTTPIQSFTYWLLPTSWGAFGKVTILQLISLVLGGVFSFSLIYRFTKSFAPSFIGSMIYNFSAYHFEKILHHLNYAMAFPFLALFFFFYFDFIDKRKLSNIVALCLSLVLLALTELTVVMMAGFIVFLHIFYLYSKYLKVNLFTQSKVFLFGLGIVISILFHIILYLANAPAYLLYSIPSIPFFCSCIAVAGLDNLVLAEKKFGYFLGLGISSIPVGIYLTLTFLSSSYLFPPDFVIRNLLLYSTPIQFLVFPSNLQWISLLGLFNSLPLSSETGVYLGIPVLLLFLLSFLYQGASEQEETFRLFSAISIIFSFPIVVVGSIPILFTIIPQPLFPLLSVLRVSSRFIIFVLLFLSIVIGMLLKRLENVHLPKLTFLILALFLIAERWPTLNGFVFDDSVPQFYTNLTLDSSNKSIFLYPNFNYYTLLEENYYQTIHNKNLSYGVVSRFPIVENDSLLFMYQTNFSEISPQNVSTIVKSGNYDYLVVQKTICSELQCFYDRFVPLPNTSLNNLIPALVKNFGLPIYEDEKIVVYSSR
ncbi:polyprenol monophosphomannose synthase [Candidatus Micrarchaeota archaeon]|nr:polyprenol monophosphomannose synthase [Candidatus Micrarchaeota archaeon]